ncbi:MAG: LPP20 family lipoprotein [Parashewanella sp.]
MKKRIGLLLCGVWLLSACQSTTKVPTWYLTPNVTNSQEIVAVGEGLNLDNAKKKALDGLNQQLWTEVSSASNSRNIVNEVNGQNHHQSLNDFSLKTRTSKLVFNGVIFSQSQQVGKQFFVEAKLNKSGLVNQLNNEIAKFNRSAQFELDRRLKTDAIVWWLSNQHLAEIEQSVDIRKSVLAALNAPVANNATTSITKLKRVLAKVKSDIKISISASRQDQQMKQFVGNLLSKYKLNIVNGNKDHFTHKIVLNSDWQHRHLAGAYIASARTDISLKNRNNTVIASAEIISTANSVSSYKRANEGVARHFSAQLKQQDFWQALGLK